MKKYAFLDFDGTLYNGFSSNNFVKFVSIKFGFDWALVREREIIESYIQGKIQYRDGTTQIAQLIADILKGMKVLDVKKLSQDFWLDSSKLIYSWSEKLIKILKNKGYLIYIISASTKENIGVACEILGVNNLIVTKLETENGKYSGIVGDILYSEIKEQKIKSIVNKVEKSFKVGVGDSSGDFGILALMDKSYLINPHKSDDIKEAEERGWYVAKNGEDLLAEIEKTA